MQLQLLAMHQTVGLINIATSPLPHKQYILLFIKYQIVSNINYIQIMQVSRKSDILCTMFVLSQINIYSLNL